MGETGMRLILTLAVVASLAALVASHVAPWAGVLLGAVAGGAWVKVFHHLSNRAGTPLS
jgi:hypothetical protein